MDAFYTSEVNTQILISLMKAHGIRKVIASPGTTNICLIRSLQHDPYFEIYSSVDERSAAYIACGLAEESGEPVALSCTGATASRNYLSGLTEAYYRKLPILAITSTQHTSRVGQNIAQVIDRSAQMKDIAKFSVEIPMVHDEDDRWGCTIDINKALLELRRNGGGPVHINLTTLYTKDFNVKELPPVQVIKRVCNGEEFPKLEGAKVGIFVGAHSKWSDRLTNLVDRFCEKYNGVVICDNTSNYRGKYGVNASLIQNQEQYISPCKTMDLLIHIGNVSGAYIGFLHKKAWRVNPDGEVRDTFRKLSHVFEMEEEAFFTHYVGDYETGMQSAYAKEYQAEYARLYNNIPELPFSNIWIAKQTAPRVPENCIVHLGILNTLRAWNFFEFPKSVYSYSNTGGFGIDGCVSALLGASLANPSKLHFGIVGDLAFFYDMNSLGNRHVLNNVRLMVVNNGCGTEFKNYSHMAGNYGDEANPYIAAVGHFGQKSPELLKHYAMDLGFTYISASNKEEYLKNMEYFISDEEYDMPVVFEVFTNSSDESAALKCMNNLETSTVGMAKKVAMDILGPKAVRAVRDLITK